MKSTLLMAIALIFSVSFANAQMKSDSSKMHSKMNSSTMSSNSQPKDYVTMKGGKVMENNNGTWSTMSSTFTTSDGCKVASDGTVTKKDGTTKMMKEGDKVYKDGHWGMAKAGTPKSNSTTTTPK